MELLRIFSGSGVVAVDGHGGLGLPGFILAALDVERSGGRIVFLAHDCDPCLTAAGADYLGLLMRAVERRRRREERRGIAAGAHHSRCRRAFGAAEWSEIGPSGRLVLPPLARRLAGIGGAALLVGAGSSFEIWNPRRAMDAGEAELRSIAEYRMQQHEHVLEAEVCG
jgi:MraZ protein